MLPAAVTRAPDTRRRAVVDLGSNSVRLVVFEGSGRNPVPIFNEKAVLRLGRGLQATGRLNEDGTTQALTVMNRYAAIARAMQADPGCLTSADWIRSAPKAISVRAMSDLAGSTDNARQSVFCTCSWARASSSRACCCSRSKRSCI